MGAITAFLYGWVTGIVAIVLCILYGFDTLLYILRLLSKVLRRVPFLAHAKMDTLSSAADAIQRKGKEDRHARHAEAKASLRERGLEGIVADTATAATPLKLASSCTVSCYEGGVAGPPVRCRFVLLGSSLSVYELLPSAGGAGGAGRGTDGSRDGTGRKGDGATEKSAHDHDRDILTAEHLRGRTEATRLSATLEKRPSKDRAHPNNPFVGRILIVESIDHMPVMDASGGSATGSSFRDDSASAESERSQTLPSLPSVSSGASGVKREGGPLLDDTSVDEITASSSTLRHRRGGHKGMASGGVETSNSRRGLDTWRRVIIKFRDNRETERWLNLFSGLREAEAWRAFSKSVPNPDTANLFISRFFFQNMQGTGLADAIRYQIQKKLKKISITKLPRDVGGQIFLDDFVIGTEIPWMSDVSEPTLSTNGEFGFDFNLHYKGGAGGFTLFFRLALSYRDIRIPHVVFSIKLLELEATVHVSVGPPPSKKFWIAGHKPPVLRLEVRQGCASGKGLLHRIMTSLPDLSGILSNLIKLYLISDMVLPYMDDFPLPSVGDEPKPAVSEERKSRVFDRRRAAEKSGAPMTSVAPSMHRPLSTPPGEDPLSALPGSGSANSAAFSASPSVGDLYSLPSALTGDRASNRSTHDSSPRPQVVAGPLWGSTSRRHADGTDTSSQQYSLRRAGTASSSLHYAPHSLASAMDGADRGAESVSEAATRSAAGGDAVTESSGRGGVTEGHSVMEETTMEFGTETHKTKRDRAARLRSLLKLKSGDMSRASVAKAQKKK